MDMIGTDSRVFRLVRWVLCNEDEEDLDKVLSQERLEGREVCWNIPSSKLELVQVIPPACVLSKPSGVNLVMFVLVSSEQTFSYCTRHYRSQ